MAGEDILVIKTEIKRHWTGSLKESRWMLYRKSGGGEFEDIDKNTYLGYVRDLGLRHVREYESWTGDWTPIYVNPSTVETISPDRGGEYPTVVMDGGGVKFLGGVGVADLRVAMGS